MPPNYDAHSRILMTEQKGCVEQPGNVTARLAVHVQTSQNSGLNNSISLGLIENTFCQ